MTDMNYRRKWDKEINSIYANKIFKDSEIIYTKFKKYKIIGDMDSVDKQLLFQTETNDDNPIIICYSSSLPLEMLPRIESNNRLKILFSITIFEKLEDGST